jgi:glycosyltransferase involved in cell wall biosynthesis
MNSRPLVTVLLLSYRHEKFVAEAARSVLEQTYRPVEIIILDDASPDGTWAALTAELARHGDRDEVRAIRHPHNLGFRGNTIAGIDESHGQFVVRLAADDVFEPLLIERMVETWQRDGVSLVTVNATYIDECSNPLNRIYLDPTAACDDSIETLVRDGSNTVCFGPILGFERSLYDEFGWAPDHLEASDIILTFYAHLANGVRFIREPLFRYRIHGGNASHSLAIERATNPVDRLLAQEQDFYLHIAHSLFMHDELDRLYQRDPNRFGDMRNHLRPLLAVQTSEMARKLVRARKALRELGVRRLGPAQITS